MSDRERRSGEAGVEPDDVGEIVNPEDLPTRIEVSEHDGVTRIDIADDADIRPGEVDEP